MGSHILHIAFELLWLYWVIGLCSFLNEYEKGRSLNSKDFILHIFLWPERFRIIKHIIYAKYIVKHKWFVFRAGLVLKVPLWRLIKHDLSKLLPSEWLPYTNWFNGAPEERDKKKFQAAVELHKSRNDHHYEYWLDAPGTYPSGEWMLNMLKGNEMVTDMPREAFLEMVADWAGAGRELQKCWSPRGWFSDHPKIMNSFYYRDRVEIHKLCCILEEHFGEQ
jgi:hypothetical protein